MKQLLKKFFIPLLALMVVVIIFLVSKVISAPNTKNSSVAIKASSVVSSVAPVTSSTPSSAASSAQIEEAGGFDANISGIPIICYHHFLTREQKGKLVNSIIATTDELESQLKLLREKGYTSLSGNQVLDYIKEGKKVPKKSVFITIDDGYKSSVYLAAPLFRKYGFKAMLFMITSHLEEPDQEFDPVKYGIYQYLNQTEMESTKDVFEYADHTYNLHTELTKQPKDKIIADLTISKGKLASPFFAYPIGDYNSNLQTLVKDFGFSAAFTIKRGHTKIHSNLYAIPRYCVLSPTTAQKVLDIVEARAVK